MPSIVQGAGDLPSCHRVRRSERSGAILRSTGVWPAYCLMLSRASIYPRQQIVEHLGRLLQVAQARRVWRGDVDGEIAGDRRQNVRSAGDNPRLRSVVSLLAPMLTPTMPPRGARAPSAACSTRPAAVIVEAQPVDDAFIAHSG